MKVYSSARNQRKSMAMNEVVRNNLDSLSQMLRNHTSQSLSLTSSLQSLDTEAEALSLARQFVTALNDPYRAMLLYPLILDSSYSYTADPLFTQTTFPEELHSLLSLYLHKSSGYSLFQRQGRRIVDMFYHYIAVEAQQVLEEWLKQNQNQSLGQWFFTECIAGFFQMIYREKDTFTIFLTNFLKQGIAYLFLAAEHAFKKMNPPQADELVLQRIRLCYLQKYGLTSR